MFFLQPFITNLVLTNTSCPKCHAVASTVPIFAGSFVCHTDLSGGGGVAVAVLLGIEPGYILFPSHKKQCIYLVRRTAIV
jgi:hypothetical protein